MVTLYDISLKIISNQKNESSVEPVTENIHRNHVRSFKDLISYMGIPYQIFKTYSVKREKFWFQDESVPYLICLIQGKNNIKRNINRSYESKNNQEFMKHIKPIIDFLSVEFKDQPFILQQCLCCIQYKFRMDEASLSTDAMNLIKNINSPYPFDQPVLYSWYLREKNKDYDRLKTLCYQVEEYRREELYDMYQVINDEVGKEKLLITKEDAENFIKYYTDGISNDFTTELTIALVYKLSKKYQHQTENELTELANSIFKAYNVPNDQSLNQHDEKKYAKYSTIPGLVEYMQKVIQSLESWKEKGFRGRNPFFELLHETDDEKKGANITVDIEIFDYMSSVEVIRYLEKRNKEIARKT